MAIMTILKLRLSDDIGEVEIANENETEWLGYENASDCQPDMFFRSAEEEQLTVYREYIEKQKDVEASHDMADHYIKCHIVMVLRLAGEDIIHIERSCDPHRKEVTEAMEAMIKSLSRLAGMTI